MEPSQNNLKKEFVWNNNYVIGIMVIVLTLVIGYKVAITDFSKLVIVNVDFSLVLSVILAIFSIALSVAFYFKATDSSSQFYDNIYKFTQDVSTNLGKIEAGFGEKLTNLDKGYRDLNNTIYNTPNAKNNSPIKSQDNVGKPLDKQNLSKTLALFSDATVNIFKGYVEDESKYAEEQTDAAKVQVLLDYSSIIYLKSKFEIIYDNIFGSQIALLQYLNSKTSDGDIIENLKTYYDQACINYPALTGYPYEDYIGFLKNFQLVNAVENKLVISVIGKDFLSYLTQANKNLTKKY